VARDGAVRGVKSQGERWRRSGKTLVKIVGFALKKKSR